MFTAFAQAAPRQNIDWTNLLTTSFGIFFSLIIGFFVLQFVLAAITLATDYGNEKALETAKKTLSSAIKGLVISLGSWIVLNSILPALGINTSITNPIDTLSTKLRQVETCIRDYSNCTSK